MTITWLGHACFRLEQGGYSIIIDPYNSVTGYPDIQTEANAVWCSHGHHDHSYTAGVTLLPAGEDPFMVTEIPSFHDGEGGALRGSNLIRVFEAEGVRVCHLGDLGHRLSAEQVSAIGPVDVLLVPVGGFYTIGPEDAKAVAEQIGPRCIVPMHYRHGHHGPDKIGGVEQFLKLFPGGDVTVLPGPSLTVTPETRGIVVPAWRG